MSISKEQLQGLATEDTESGSLSKPVHARQEQLPTVHSSMLFCPEAHNNSVSDDAASMSNSGRQANLSQSLDFETVTETDSNSSYETEMDLDLRSTVSVGALSSNPSDPSFLYAKGPPTHMGISHFSDVTSQC